MKPIPAVVRALRDTHFKADACFFNEIPDVGIPLWMRESGAACTRGMPLHVYMCIIYRSLLLADVIAVDV